MGRRSSCEVGDEVADLCVKVVARLGMRWQADRVADLHGEEEADPDDCDLDGDLRWRHGISGKRAIRLGVKTGRQAGRQGGIEDGLGFGRTARRRGKFRK